MSLTELMFQLVVMYYVTTIKHFTEHVVCLMLTNMSNVYGEFDVFLFSFWSYLLPMIYTKYCFLQC